MRIRFNNTEAGSSSGSRATNRPEKALFRTAKRRESDRRNSASICAIALSMTESLEEIRFTISTCFSRQQRGIGNAFKIEMFNPGRVCLCAIHTFALDSQLETEAED